MNRRTLCFLLLGAPFVSACAFLLDFGELQRGPQKSSDAGAGSGGHAGGGSGGQTADAATGTDAAPDVDAAPVCPTDCVDSDPCTVHTCERSGCTNTYTAGIVPDGLSETVTGEKFHRVTMTSLGNRFYLSALKSAGTTFDVELRQFGRADTKASPAVLLSASPSLPVGAMPVSAMGLAPGTSGLDIEGYAALGQSPTAPAQVWKFRFDPDLKLLDGVAASPDANYLGGPRVYPVAWSQGVTGVWGAWPGNGNGVYLHGGTPLPVGAPPAIATTAQVVSLAPLGYASVPGVLYVSDRPYSQALGQLGPVPLGQCDTRAGSFSTALSAFTGLPDLWIGGWSKSVGTSVLTEQLPLVCTASGGSSACFGDTKCDPTKELIPNVRNPSITFFSVQGDPPGRVYEVLVLPYIDLNVREASLQLQVTRADFDLTGADAGVQTLVLNPTLVKLAAAHVTKIEQGPDLPAVAFVGPDRFAVAWIQPSATGTGDELRVERERICFPKK